MKKVVIFCSAIALFCFASVSNAQKNDSVIKSITKLGVTITEIKTESGIKSFAKNTTNSEKRVEYIKINSKGQEEFHAYTLKLAEGQELNIDEHFCIDHRGVKICDKDICSEFIPLHNKYRSMSSVEEVEEGLQPLEKK